MYLKVAQLDGSNSKTATNPYVLFEVGLFGGAASDVDPADTAYFYRDALFNVGLYLAVPLDRKDAKDLYKEQSAAIDSIWSDLQEERIFFGMYPNYQIEGLTDKEYPMQYWGGNFERLQSIKAIYDPSNVFDHSQGIRAVSYY